jgi:hypothetical protein
LGNDAVKINNATYYFRDGKLSEFEESQQQQIAEAPKFFGFSSFRNDEGGQDAG